MAKVKCPSCGKKFSGRFCPNCGAPAPENAKKGFSLLKIGVIAVIIVVLFSACFGGGDDSKSESGAVEEIQAATSAEVETAEETKEPEQAKEEERTPEPVTVFDSDDIKIQITGYELSKVFDMVEVKVYIENNSDRNINVSVDGSPSIDGFVIDGGWFYENVAAGKKDNASFTLYNMRDNGIENAEEAQSIEFLLDIFDSDTYHDIQQNISVQYDFK